MKKLIPLLALIACGPAPQPAPTPDAGHYDLVDPFTVLYVLDGDTIHVRRGDEEHRIRFKGVNTPETEKDDSAAEPCADEAMAFTTRHVGLQVDLEFDDACGDDPLNDEACRGVYDRVLAYVRTSKGEDLGALLLDEGLASVMSFTHQGQPFDREVDYTARERSSAQRGGCVHR